MFLNKADTLHRVLHYILLILFVVPLLTSCASRRVIVNNLDENEANEIIVFLESKNIDANKEKAPEATGGGSKAVMWNISVPEIEATDAMAILNQHGLPRRRGQSLLSIFSNVGLVPSELQEKIRYQAGLGETIANTIRKIDGVLDSEVQISIPEEDPLNPDKNKMKKITASVYVKHSGVFDDPNAHLAAKIKRLVAASVPGLDYDNVTVVAERARFAYDTDMLFSDTDEKEYVSLWTIIVATESITRFRILFLAFTLAILGLLFTLGWLLWKIFPLLSHCGGFKELFSLRALSLKKGAAPLSGAAAAPPAREGSDKAKEASQEEGLDESTLDDSDQS